MGLFSKKKKRESEVVGDSGSNVQRSWQAAIDHGRKMTIMLGFSVAIIGVLALKIMTTKPIVIITPPNLSEDITMIGNAASASYKKQWGIFIADMLGNVNVRNVDLVLETLKPMLSIRDYDALNEQVVGPC